INENDNFHHADAEGFSAAISPSYEYADIDALNNKTITGTEFSITMKNEALETHCINEIKLLACPRKEGQRIYQSDKDEFYLCRNNYPLASARGDEGDISALLAYDDGQERFSPADENNLKSKEEIFLEFDHVNTSDQHGLIISFRQTLMTTYLIYNAIAYMGDEVGDVFAGIETSGSESGLIKKGILNELGKIDVYTLNNDKNNWEYQGGWYETGPIAMNHQILPLKFKEDQEHIKIKLVINKGYWRIDYLALTDIIEKTEPIEIQPSFVINKGKTNDKALALVTDPDHYLVSMPGDKYKFIFNLPSPQQDYELFLYSKGYYLEWMRNSWLHEKNKFKLWQMLHTPAAYLRHEAKKFKIYEHNMEQQFWDSKIETNQFSLYEN
ncbi:MAG: hypothetical protein NTW49_06260, partial [Bacteroidia bacterium]|nr:hypothetical protein [Bacteroidia bacterium]